jgi:hypothetical protein
VVFVHGTVSSPGRWANMLNDLENDGRVRNRFQFWFCGERQYKAERPTTGYVNPPGRNSR